MPRHRGRSRRKAACRGTGEAKKERPVAQAAVPSERPVSAVKGLGTAPAAPRTRLQQSPTQLKLSTEEQTRILRGDLRRVGIITAALIALLVILSQVL